MKKLLLLMIYSIFLFADSSYDNPREFSLLSKNNIHGDVKLIGNSVLEAPNGTCLSQTTTNNQVYSVYADIDNDSNTYNSTWAKLKLPAGITSNNIVFARLYWQGRIYDPDMYSNINETILNNDLNKAKTVKIKLYGSNNYTTLTTIPEDFNYIIETRHHNRINYQGVADITNLLKQSLDADSSADSTGYNKEVWVADVFTSSNSPSALVNGDTSYYGRQRTNLYGAWSLLVVYEDEDAHLKNISVYDGYTELGDPTPTGSITLSGFLTPLKGEVNANFMAFAGEGDYDYGDSISISNKDGDDIEIDDNFFRSSEDIDGENITDREPNCENTIGIDIRIRSIGTNGKNPVIENGQTSTTIKFDSHEHYFPGLFIFSTDLYEPRVCYYIDTIKDEDGNTVYENRQFTGDIDTNKKYNISFWIANMKKDSSDEDLEVAKKVQVFLDTNDFEYISNSTYIKNIGDIDFSHKTDTKDSDIFEYISDHNQSVYRLGIDANGTDGGTIDVANSFDDDAKKAFIDINGTFIADPNQDTINLDNILHFKAAFATDSIAISPEEALPIPKCIDFNSEGSVFTPSIGKFNIVNENFTGSTDPIDPTDPLNALYTQIAHHSFSVMLLSLKDDFKTLKKFAGSVNIELIETPDYQENDTDDAKQQKCIDATTLKTRNIYLKNKSKKTFTLTYNQINKNVTFRIAYFNYSGCNDPDIKKFASCQYQHYQNLVTDCDNQCKDSASNNSNARNCLRCMFQHRNTNIFSYTCARDNFAVRPDRFDIITPTFSRASKNISDLIMQAVDANNNKKPAYTGVPSSDLNLTAQEYNTSCIQSTLSYDFTFENGKANINYVKYPEVGNIRLQLAEIIGHEYAIVDAKDTPDAQRLITPGVSNYFRILPDHFNISSINFSNFNNSSFTYLSNDLNMSANLQAIITAVNADGAITQNYNAGCYAKDTNFTITHISNSTMDNLNNILTQFSSNPKNSNIKFQLNENNFSNGAAILNLKINFDRNSSKDKIVDPFILALNNIDIQDQNETNGTASINQIANFIYGRILTNNISTIENTANIGIIFQKYDGSNWITNTAHTNKIFGDVNKTFTTSNITVNLNENNIINGEQNLTASPNVITRPYKAKLHLNIPTWLWYSNYNKEYIAPNSTNTDCTTHPCVNVLFLPKTDETWSGAGTNQTENNVTNNTVHSTIKQNTKKNNSFHKISW